MDDIQKFLTDNKVLSLIVFAIGFLAYKKYIDPESDTFSRKAFKLVGIIGSVIGIYFIQWVIRYGAKELMDDINIESLGYGLLVLIVSFITLVVTFTLSYACISLLHRFIERTLNESAYIYLSISIISMVMTSLTGDMSRLELNGHLYIISFNCTLVALSYSGKLFKNQIKNNG